MACDSALVCSGNNTCVVVTCPAGSQGCACLTNNTCNSGFACQAGTCVVDVPTALPTSCYVPCSTGAVVGATYRSCSAQGLMRFAEGENCPDDGDAATGIPTCQAGTCRLAGVPAPACTTGLECPDFQACIAGSCRPDCENDSHCSQGKICSLKVCRAPCTASTSSCGQDQYCATTDGENGVCMPLAQPTGTPQLEVVGAYKVFAEDALEFSNVRVSGNFSIENQSPTYQEFKVRKVSHTETQASGPVTETMMPLFWLGLGTPGMVQQVNEVTIGINAGETATVAIENAHNANISLWNGVLEVSNAVLGKQRLTLSYASRPEGRWQGRMYFFGNFPDIGLEEWRANPNSTNLANVRNAFVHKWTEFKSGALSLRELYAVLTATQTESWRYENVKARCPTAAAPDPNRACYLFENTQGYGLFSSSLDSRPVPTGVVELPLAMNLHAANSGMPTRLTGKILTSGSLHYAGDPAIQIDFASDPTTCTQMNGNNCVVPMTGLDAKVFVGGRFSPPGGGSTCTAVGSPNDFKLTSIPWLVPGFQRGTAVDDDTGIRYRRECRDNTLPYDDAMLEEINRSLAISNPIPDGRPRKRYLELIDGALINQTTLFIIFRERFESFLSATDPDLTAYGYIVLERGAANLKAEDYAGTNPVDTRTLTPVSTLSCNAAVLAKVGVNTVVGNEALLVNALISGVKPGASPTPLNNANIHYYCEDTGEIDGGVDAVARQACPPGSRVTFFYLASEPSGGTHALPCQATASCQDTLNNWVANGAYGIQVNPTWRCQDANKVYCDTDRNDLRTGKLFYGAAQSQSVFVPLLPEVDDAFRFKTRFRNRQGTSLGFAPAICIPDSDAIPYCYDPVAIEGAEDRGDCLLSIYADAARRGALDQPTRQLLEDTLAVNFSWAEEPVAGQSLPNIHDGLEKLNAELHIMLGDDSYTKAFASRFDLAGSGLASFEGSRFEVGGINLSGAAGFEMHSLYLATQYYQDALDRFYRHAPQLFVYLEAMRGSANNPALNVGEAYFGRLIRASSQKTRAWSEVAKRYQSFNRPDLARRVIERAYTGAYLESVVLSSMMNRLIGTTGVSGRAQIVKAAENAQRAYRAALLDMRDVYSNISDNLNYFGFAPEYIPFPALEAADANAFDKANRVARQRLAVAADKEAAALASNRSYDTDQAAFQSELTRVRNNYENELAQLCGTFQAADGTVYPAIRKYAHLSEPTSIIGDPCGLVGNGAIHEATAQLELSGLDFQGVVRGYDNAVERINIENERVNAQCNLTMTLADYQWEVAGRIDNLQGYIGKSRFAIDAAERIFNTIEAATSGLDCFVILGTASGTNCVGAAARAGTLAAGQSVFNAISLVNEGIILAKEDEIGEIQREAARWQTQQQCTAAQIDSDASVKQMLLELNRYELDALRANYSVRLALSGIEKLRHQAKRLVAEQEESEELAINTQAAQNNPNVRIYKNDAIITADRTFQAALKEAYKATRVFEYYTSQSYPGWEKLFLVRMVGAGDNSLEQYLFELEDAFLAFQEQYGLPDHRVAIVSMRDHVLAIPRTDDNNKALTLAERVDLFRAALADPGRVDQSGYLSFPFATTTSQLSPLTRNHKIDYIEAEVVGSDVGDTVGRIYLRQTGTGTVSSLEGSDSYFAFPKHTAVVNTLFNGQRVLPPNVYQNARMRDRPVANSRWELLINQRDELVNKDINLQSLTDIRLYVYYSDFTRL